MSLSQAHSDGGHICTVPDDILREIFLHCLPTNAWKITPALDSAPTLLMLVCKHWRDVAVNFPSLWAWLKLPVKKTLFDKEKKGLALLQALLRRAQSTPLSLTISSRKWCPWVFETGFLHQLLLPSAASLTRLVLFEVGQCQLQALPRGLFPALESLVLNRNDEGFDWALNCGKPQNPIVAFEDSANLRRVALDTTFAVADGSIGLHLPWSQLTHFRETDYQKDKFAIIGQHLPQCRNLRWLGLELQEDDINRKRPLTDWEVMGSTPIIMENIRTLSLRFGGYPHVLFYPDLWDRFDFPNLMTLQLSSSDIDGPGDFFDSFTLKLDSFAHLQYLSLELETIPGAVLMDIFDHTPNVTTLHAYIDQGYDILFLLLRTVEDEIQEDCEGESVPSMLPRLKTLILEGGSSHIDPDEERIEHDAFASMVAARLRFKDEHRLEKIVIYCENDDDLPDDLVDEMEELDEEGVIRFEKRVAKLDNRKAETWMERDPETRGWAEAAFVEPPWDPTYPSSSSDEE